MMPCWRTEACIIFSVFHAKGRTILGARVPAIIDAGNSDIGVPKPPLDFSDFHSVVEGWRQKGKESYATLATLGF